MRKVHLTLHKMLKFKKEKWQDSLSPNLQKYYEAKEEMNDWLETMTCPKIQKPPCMHSNFKG